MAALDSMCLGSGTRHDVAPFSGGYVLLELCAPAVYDTDGVPPPAPGNGGADAPAR